MFSCRVLKETAECPVPSKPFRLPPLATDRSGRGARRARRRPGGKSRSSVSGTAAFRSPASRRGRARRQSRLAGKWRRNGLIRLNPRREMVWPRQPCTPNIWHQGVRRRWSVIARTPGSQPGGRGDPVSRRSPSFSWIASPRGPGPGVAMTTFGRRARLGGLAEQVAERDSFWHLSA